MNDNKLGEKKQLRNVDWNSRRKKRWLEIRDKN